MPVEAAVAAGTTTMEITVSKFELLRELTATQGVVERKTTIPILSNYLFEAAGDRLSLTATDLDLSLRTSCEAKVKKEGSCTIPARKLHDYVKLLPDADITIKLLENHWVSIRCGRSNTKMVGMAKSNFPSLPAFPSAGAVKIPAPVLRGPPRIAWALRSRPPAERRYSLKLPTRRPSSHPSWARRAVAVRTSRSLRPKGAATRIRLPSAMAPPRGMMESPKMVTRSEPPRSGRWRRKRLTSSAATVDGSLGIVEGHYNYYPPAGALCFGSGFL